MPVSSDGRSDSAVSRIHTPGIFLRWSSTTDDRAEREEPVRQHRQLGVAVEQPDRADLLPPRLGREEHERVTRSVVAVPAPCRDDDDGRARDQ